MKPLEQISVAGLRLEYRDIPAARLDMPPILLLHEGLGCVAMWRNFPDALAAATGCRTIVWSRAGYGASDPYATARRSDYLQYEAHEALPALLAAFKVQRPLLVGHSDGGSIALLYASAFPALPLGVVAMAPHEFVEAETLAGIRLAVQAWEETDLPQRLGRYHLQPERVFREWADTWLAPEYRGWTIEHHLAAISCPVLAIQGEDDEYASMRQIDAIAEKVPATRLLKLAACGHSPHKDQMLAVLAAISAFVGGNISHP